MTDPAGATKAVRTRDAILEAAEQLFAEHGFEGTRLEQVAESVGIRRASIVYHFRDKRELYGAVLDELVMGLFVPVQRALEQSGPLAERIEQAVSAFIDFVAERPTAARIALREIADGAGERRAELVRHLAPFAALIPRVRANRGAARYPKADPVQVASAIAGTTIFHLVAMPTIAPGIEYDPLQPERLEQLRSEVIRMARGLLGEHSGVEDV